MEFFRFTIRFFASRGRLVGFFTLILGCILTFAWIRSEQGVDIFAYGKRTNSFSVRSRSGVLEFHRDVPNVMLGEWIGKQGGPIEYANLMRYHSMSFSLYSDHKNREQAAADESTKLWGVSYRVIVIPLALLTAWLLLFSSRSKSKQHRALTSDPE